MHLKINDDVNVPQHYPLYRDSDAVCDEPDEAPQDIKHTRFRERWECLSKDATEMVRLLRRWFSFIKPVPFTAHILQSSHSSSLPVLFIRLHYTWPSPASPASVVNPWLHARVWLPCVSVGVTILSCLAFSLLLSLLFPQCLLSFLSSCNVRKVYSID